MQIDASKYWLNTYFPDTKDFDKSRNTVIKLMDKAVSENIKNVETMQKKLDF